MTCGIYKIENKVNKKCYIGQSTNIEKRWQSHRIIGKNENAKEKNYPLYKAMYKYGLDNFNFEIIEECNRELLDEKEIYWINFYDSLKNGYNQVPGGTYFMPCTDKEILDLWKQGYFIKEIQIKYHISSENVHRALISQGISDKDIRSQSQKNSKKRVIALSPIDKAPLKIFSSISEAEKFLGGVRTISRSIKKGQKSNGYYWTFWNEENIPERELTEEEFLSYQDITYKKYVMSEEIKEKISQKNRKIERPTREELKNLIRIKPFVQIANQFNTNSSTILQWCKMYNLPNRKRDINNFSNEEWEEV